MARTTPSFIRTPRALAVKNKITGSATTEIIENFHNGIADRSAMGVRMSTAQIARFNRVPGLK